MSSVDASWAVAPEGHQITADPRRISPRDHIYGDPDALVQVVIYGHLGSERTAQAYRAVHDTAFRYRCIRATLRYRLPDGDRAAWASAAAAEAIARFDLYWPFVDQVFRLGDDPASLRRACRALDIDEEVIDEQDAVARSASRLAEDRRLAELAGADSTPTVFINGVRWRPGDTLAGDLCRLAELTRPLWMGAERRHLRRPR